MAITFSLDHVAARDPSRAGRKAAALAEARRRGFPVLAGQVIPSGAAAAAMDLGGRILLTDGPGKARMAVARLAKAPDLAEDLGALRALGEPLVVRSSTLLDNDPNWSGAFSSCGDVRVDEVETAVRGCWASVFAPDSLGRLERTGRSHAGVGMAVLIQPQLMPSCGGWSRAGRDGSVTIVGTPGAPAPLLAGAVGGVRASVGPDGTIAGDLDGMALNEVAARCLADLARRAWDELGMDRLEWAVDGGTLWVLQLSRLDADDRTPVQAGSPPTTVDAVGDGVVALSRLLDVLVDRRGPLAEEVLIPWVCADLGEAPVVAPLRVAGGDPETLLVDVMERARSLRDRLGRDLGLDPERIAEWLAALDPDLTRRLAAAALPHAAETLQRVLTNVEAVGAQLTKAGALAFPAQVWWQTRDWLVQAARTVSGERGGVAQDFLPPAAERAFDRWTEALFIAVTARGVAGTGTGTGCVPGRAVGRAFRVRPGEIELAHVRGRILVVHQPLTQYAPLLWKAAGLVSETGGQAAHLCEVARSLHVPAVVGVHLSGVLDGSVIALDGATGEVWHVPAVEIR